MTILVADDEPWIRKGLISALRTLLKDRSPDIVEADDGLAAWERARESPPDLVLVDIHMPRLKGLDLVERLKTLPHLGPIIVITGHDEFEYAQRALQLRVFDFLLKPVPDEALRDVLTRAVAEHDRLLLARDKTGWTQRQLDQRGREILTRDLRDWLDGRLPLDGLRSSATFLNQVWVDRPTVLLMSWRGPRPDEMMGPLQKRLEAAAPQVWFVPFPPDQLLAILDAPPSFALVDDPDAATLVVEELSLPWEQIPAAVQPWRTRASDENWGLSSAAKAYLDRHFADPGLSLETAAAHLRISPNHLSRILKSLVGQSFSPYVLSLRLDWAQRLLGDPRLRVSEVAARVGFRDQNYFARQFRALTGQSPLEWRRSRREES